MFFSRKKRTSQFSARELQIGNGVLCQKKTHFSFFVRELQVGNREPDGLFIEDRYTDRYDGSDGYSSRFV
jgi:hypothetical protein